MVFQAIERVLLSVQQEIMGKAVNAFALPYRLVCRSRPFQPRPIPFRMERDHVANCERPCRVERVMNHLALVII